MIEMFFLIGTEIRLGTGHPEKVAVEQDLLTPRPWGVMPGQPFQREREHSIDAPIDEAFAGSRLAIQERGPSAFGSDIFTPDHGVAEQDDIGRCGDLSDPLRIKPVIPTAYYPPFFTKDLEAHGVDLRPSRRGSVAVRRPFPVAAPVVRNVRNQLLVMAAASAGVALVAVPGVWPVTLLGPGGGVPDA